MTRSTKSRKPAIGTVRPPATERAMRRWAYERMRKAFRAHPDQTELNEGWSTYNAIVKDYQQDLEQIDAAFSPKVMPCAK